MGDHIYRRREIYCVLEHEERIVKPANYPSEAPGRDVALVRARNDVHVAVFSLLGRVFMPPVDCPLQAADRVLAGLPADVKVILLDFHAEATSDKQLMGRHLDGRVSAVLGTHTHVPTADEQILPGGTAFQCDVGMTGPHRKHPRPADRPGAGDDPDLPAHAFRSGRRGRRAFAGRSSRWTRTPAGPRGSAASWWTRARQTGWLNRSHRAALNRVERVEPASGRCPSDAPARCPGRARPVRQ